MAHYLLMAAYTPEVLKALVTDPTALALREKHAEVFYGSIGGKVKQAFFIRDGSFHFMVIVDFPSHEAAHAAMMVGQASGAFTNCVAYSLSTFEEAQQAVNLSGAAAAVFFAPGEAPKK